MLKHLTSIPLFLNTLFLWKPQDSPSATVIIWLLRIVTFSLFFRSFVGPSILRLLSSRLRVQSVSLRSIRGIYFRAGKAVLHVERVGLGYHRPSAESASRFSIRVEGVRLEITKADCKVWKPFTRKRSRVPRLEDLAPFPLALLAWSAVRAAGVWVYTISEPFVRPVIRAVIVSLLRVVIRALPALTQVLDLEVDSVVVTLQSVAGVEFIVHKVKVQTSVVFTQLDNSASSGVNPTLAQQTRHRRFASVADFGTRVKNSFRRSWGRAWGSTQVAASLRVDVHEVLGVASQPLLKQLNTTNTEKHTFVVVPNIAFSTLVHLDPRQQIERHGLEINLTSDAATVDIDIIQYILNVLKRQREEDEYDKASNEVPTQEQPAAQRSPPYTPSSPNLLASPSPRSGWASPMSPKSPIMEALSVRFRWRGKTHPVRRIRGRMATNHLAALRAINISFPGLTLIHRLSVTPDHHPETFKLTLEKIGIHVNLSHPDRVPLHRQWLGRTSAPEDPLTADVYAITFSINQAALDRIGFGTVVDQLRVVALGHARITVLVSQWPAPWLSGPTFLSGDPNSQFVIANVSLGIIEITEHLEVIQKLLDRGKAAKPSIKVDGYPALPPVLAPVPRMTFGLHLQGISIRLISTNVLDGRAPFALEARSDGFTVSADTHFQVLPDHRFARFPIEPDRPRLQMQMDLQATLQRTFVNINRGMADSHRESALDGSLYPGEPFISLDAIQLSGSGHAFGELADEAGGGVTIDVPSMFFASHCASDAFSVELWNPDTVTALHTILLSFSRVSKDSQYIASPSPRYLLARLPSGMSTSVAIGRFMVFITGPDLAPGEDLNIYRGVALHTGISFHYCSLRTTHCEGFTNLLSRAQKRLQLSLPTELVTTAVGGSTAAALTQSEQASMQISLWDVALRDALSTRFSADDPYGVGDMNEDYRSQEYIRVEAITVGVVLSGRRPGGVPPVGTQDDCAVSIAVTHVRGYLHLAHAYNLLLAVQAIKTLLPPKQQTKTTSSHPRTMSVSVQCNLNRVQVLWEFPLKMKMYARISSLSVQRPASGRIRVQWSAILLAVSIDIQRDGITRTEWEELARLPDWSIDIQPDVHPIAIAAEGDSARLRIPFDYVLADLILEMNMTLKSLKHLSRMVPSGKFSNPPNPEAEEAKVMPNLHVRVGRLSAEAADEDFETKLGLIWRAGFEATRLRLERDDAFEAKAATISSVNSEDPSTPAREAQSDFQFTSEHTVSIDDARSRLFQVHSGAWKSHFRQVHSQQARREEMEIHQSARRDSLTESLDTDLIVINPRRAIPPLIRLTFDGLSLHLTRPSFASNHLAEFLFREGGGLPRDTQYSLLIPMHLTFSVSSLRVTCREYPLPMLNVPAHTNKDITGLEFDSDIVIAEEMGTKRTVEWIDCAIVKPHTGVHGASPLYITVPKTLNPVKTYANPTIRVKSDDVTDFAWGVSYGPATQDIMRVIDTLSHAPRDSSPPIGFWDKLRLVFHWRLRVLFENEVHLHMKGSHDPHNLRGQGAGFALCWQGSPQLLINQPNAQNEVIQVISDSVLVIIPNIEESYGESSASDLRHDPRTGPSPPTKSRRPRKVCAKFGSGSRFGVGAVLERTCGPDCLHCSGDAFHRQCRFFDFKPHYEVVLELKDRNPIEKTVDDSYNGFRSDFIHLSISLTSSLHADGDKYSSIHLSPSVFSHFWAWWSLFDGKALPIRQGGRYKHKRPLSPKFGQHLATIKYRIEVPRLFLSHVYIDESRDAWADGVTPFVGIKAMIRHFQTDMHQRAQESIITAPDGTDKTVVHKPFDAVEVVMKDLELRALLAVFDEPLKQCVQLDPTYLESTYRKRADMPTVESDSPWADLDDFTDMEWSPKGDPQLHLLPAASCPRFTYFKQATGILADNRVENTKFGDENSHVCLLGKEASVPQVQMDITLKRINELRRMSVNGVEPCVPASPLCQGSTDTDYMVSLLEDYVKHLRQVDAQSRSVPSHGPQNYYMPADSVSPDEWAEFDNVYQVHCPKIYLDNSIRDIMMQYYYCSRARRGFEYHMATRAVKFIRDQALNAVDKLVHEPTVHKERRGTAASATQAAAHAVRKILGADGNLSTTSVEASPEPLFHTLDNKDPLKGWSKGVSLRKGHFCLLLKPQIVLRSETNAESVCVLAAVQGKLQTYNIMDDANADDPVSGKVMSRNFASLSGLQAFSPSAMNKSGLGVVPLEVLIDLRCGSNYFDRLVPQTDATFHYDKFNRLRLRNEVTSALTRKSDVDDQLHNHLHSQNDLVRFHVPRFTVSANDRHFQSISNIVTDLLLFSDAAHKTRAERLEKMLFSYDFTNLGSAADVVSKLQARLRMAVETKREAESKLQGLGDAGEIEKYKIKAHILLLGEELDYVFEAIKLAQDKADGQAGQKSALLLHASSSEISWRMIGRRDQLLAKLAVRDIDFRWLNRQDSSTLNRLAVGDLQAFDGAADAEWTEILSKHDEPANHPLVKKLFCIANWTVLPPVGGITIYEGFELMLHPLRLQIDTRVGRRIMEYVWPTRRKPRRAISTPETEGFRLPPSPSSPSAPRTPLPPQTPRRVSTDLPSSKSVDSSRLGIPQLRKTATSRSFSDLRKAASDSLQVPGLHRTRSTDMISSFSVSNSSGQVSKTSDDFRERTFTSRPIVTDDATVMKTRSSQKTFVWVKVSSLHLVLSIMKEDSFLCRDAHIQTRDLEYRNQTWSFEELVDQFIPSGRNWKGWVKMAFNQPLVPVLPVAREIISKTKWVNSKHHHESHKRGTITPRSLPFIGASRESTLNSHGEGSGKRLRTMSTMSTIRGKPQLYKAENYSSLGLVTAEPDPLPQDQEQDQQESGTRVQKPRNKLFKVFKRRRADSKTRGSMDSTRSNSTSSSWTHDTEKLDSPPDTARPVVRHSDSDFS